MTGSDSPDLLESGQPSFDAFVATIARLRAPGGCPWDREQTHASIAHNMIEEAYEAVDAIEARDVAHMREELGDVLLQVVLQCQIAADAGEFTIEDVCRDIDAKMIRRHPHVFGQAAAQSADEVLGIWDEVKLAEKKASDGDGGPTGLLAGVPTGLPALMQAQKMSRKAAAVGFEWDDDEGLFAKLDEEVAEFCAAQTPEDRELELGDVLFVVVNIARRAGIDAENALRASCVKFRHRWGFIEGAAWARGIDAADLPMDEMQALWDEAKRREGGD